MFLLSFAFLFTLSFAWQIDLIILGENINAEGFASLDVSDSVPTLLDVDSSISASFDKRTCCIMLIAYWILLYLAVDIWWSLFVVFEGGYK